MATDAEVKRGERGAITIFGDYIFHFVLLVFEGIKKPPIPKANSISGRIYSTPQGKSNECTTRRGRDC